MDAKQAAGERAADLIADGMTIGLGTGSTVAWTIRRLGERVRAGLRVRAVPTSRQTEALAREVGIPLITFAEVRELDLSVDGADEVSPSWDLIKGGGGALLREKLVAVASRQLIIVVDASKLVPVLGAFPLPVEVVPFAWETTLRRLGECGCVPVLRMADAAPFVTDNGNHVVDCAFGSIPDPAVLHAALKALPGVVETGLFPALATSLVVGSAKDVTVHQRH